MERREKNTDRGSELVKQVLVKVSQKVTLLNRYKINDTSSRKIFSADNVLLTCSKRRKGLAREREFL